MSVPGPPDPQLYQGRVLLVGNGAVGTEVACMATGFLHSPAPCSSSVLELPHMGDLSQLGMELPPPSLYIFLSSE